MAFYLGMQDTLRAGVCFTAILMSTLSLMTLGVVVEVRELGKG